MSLDLLPDDYVLGLIVHAQDIEGVSAMSRDDPPHYEEFVACVMAAVLREWICDWQAHPDDDDGRSSITFTTTHRGERALATYRRRKANA